MPEMPSTESAVTAIRAVAERYGHQVTIEHAIGADESSRRTAAGAFAVTDEDGSLPHEALLEIPAAESPLSPEIAVQVFAEGDAHITLDGITFHDVPRERAPAFLETVFDGRARVKLTWYPPYCRLIVALPGDRTYKEVVPMAHGGLSRWMNTLTP
ncbi:hypothetical protein G5C65_36035 [Streptomyces sp. SB3404]|uniref:Uncharacterized protein n=2 Tax=Streptomyces boncukensis TaxID=2711219 RepID=A0A6G4XA67_9ACTN|nr:hypothetical protein [Streptomyces boncukensis]